MSDSEPRTPNAIDIHVGARVRARRKFLNISQEKLADHLNLTFQQVQKYEKGSNRISASKLYETGRYLEVPVSFFFDGLTETPLDENDSALARQRAVEEYVMSSEGIAFAEIMMKLPMTRRRNVMELAKSLSEPA
jgi:transcriptional regulator with XRE-family HTH domain